MFEKEKKKVVCKNTTEKKEEQLTERLLHPLSEKNISSSNTLQNNQFY